jgi:Family of unknown function (DUF6328)
MAAEERYERDEDEAAQLDRHWNELLQELRLAQTGTQILFAFLLTIAFSPPFRSADRFTELVYAGTLLAAAVALALFLAPVPFHRIVYRHRLRDKLIAIAGLLTAIGLVFLLAALAGGMVMALDVVFARGTAVAVVAVVVVVFLLLWYALPTWVRGTVTRSAPADDTDIE